MADEKVQDASLDAQADGVAAADRAAVKVETATEGAVDEGIVIDGAAEAGVDEPAEADGKEKEKDARQYGDEDDEPADERFDDDGNPTLEEAATYEEDDEIPLGRIQDVLNATADTENMTPQMRRMMQRQADNTKRVQESIKGTKANPSWYVPLFCALMIIGLVWAVVFYLTGNQYPIPNIGFWNLAIAFAFILAGFLMTVGWR